MPLSWLIIASLLFCYAQSVGNCQPKPGTAVTTVCGSTSHPLCYNSCILASECEWSIAGGNDYDEYPQMSQTTNTYAKDQQTRLGALQSGGSSLIVASEMVRILAAWPSVYSYIRYQGLFEKAKDKSGDSSTLIANFQDDIIICFNIGPQSKAFFGMIEKRMNSDPSFKRMLVNALASIGSGPAPLGVNIDEALWWAAKFKPMAQKVRATLSKLRGGSAHREYEDEYSDNDLYTAHDYDIYEELVRKYTRDKKVTKRLLNNEMKNILSVKRRLPH